ncbi:MAG: Calcium-binding acidic-repeat protein, partial [Solirubrobacterales bacterium]|nr:Calcium-binding acidic-repeat protein [Solirubrobacterales bacterium]
MSGFAQVDARLNKVLIRGTKMQAEVQEAVTGASVDIGTEDVTQLTISLADPGLDIANAQIATIGATCVYEDLNMAIA